MKKVLIEQIRLEKCNAAALGAYNAAIANGKTETSNESKNKPEMSAKELHSAYVKKADEIKRKLTKSYFSGDKKYFNKILSKYPFAKNDAYNVYDTINNLSAKVAQDHKY